MIKPKHLSSYIQQLDAYSPGVSSSVKKTVEDIIGRELLNYDFKENKIGLLLGNVQSGKTSQIFGIIAGAADLGIDLFVLMTTDNVYLHEQTVQRALRLLDTFNVCGEYDEIRFTSGGMRKPTLIVLKKNTNILKKWRNNLSSSGFCSDRPLFIVDDEGDAASLNTKINKREQSTINKHLESMQKLAVSSFYLQVTATPQSLLLQTKLSGWKPSFVYYFPPGKTYLGGDFFYSDPTSYVIRLTGEDELAAMRSDEGEVSEGLKNALLSFLIATAHIFLSEQGSVCNFLVHPSVRIADHEMIIDRLGQILNTLLLAIAENRLEEPLKKAWDDMQQTKPDLIKFEKASKYIHDLLNEERINLHVMNSRASQQIDCTKGINIVVGGNSLGRGVTFKGLQTIYYCRKAKSPLADTFWQHSRMFGYDRDPGLMRLYLPPSLLKLFIELNNGNRALIAQIEGADIADVSLLYPPGVKPTRANVIDKSALDMIVGGVNYFPSAPVNKSREKIDDLLDGFDDEGYEVVDLKFLITLLKMIGTDDKADWSGGAFINCIKALQSNGAKDEAALIVRRGRNIAKGTGTLLSQNDRALGDEIHKIPVLTMYRLTGEKSKGWADEPIWVPNIKLPNKVNFFKSSQ